MINTKMCFLSVFESCFLKAFKCLIICYSVRSYCAQTQQGRTRYSYHWGSISLSQHNQTEQRKNHNAINEVSKGDCIIMGDFNHGNIKWDTLEGTGVEDNTFLCLVQYNFLTQHKIR